MSVATANTAGHTKKVTTNAMLLIGENDHDPSWKGLMANALTGYCLGNFIGKSHYDIF